MKRFRLFLYWAITFFIVYLISVLTSTAWRIFDYNSIFLVIGTVNSPLVFLFFGWLYFRKQKHLLLSVRVKIAFYWIVLNVVATVILLKFVYGMSIFVEFSTQGMLIEAGNFVALLLAGYVATVHTKLPSFPKAKPPTSPKIS